MTAPLKKVSSGIVPSAQTALGAASTATTRADVASRPPNRRPSRRMRRLRTIDSVRREESLARARKQDTRRTSPWDAARRESVPAGLPVDWRKSKKGLGDPLAPRDAQPVPDRPQRSPRPDSRPARRRGPRRVLVVRLSAIGDVLHAMPAVHSLKAARPDLEIDWLVEDRAAAVLDGFAAVERVHRVPRARWSRALRRVATWPRLALEVTRFVAGLVARRYDATLDLQGNLKSGVWALASGAPARVGFATEETREA